MSLPQPISGLVISCSQGYTLVAIGCASVGLFQGGGAVLFGGAVWVGIHIDPNSRVMIAWFALLALAGLATASWLFWLSWYLPTHRPELVLGYDRMQWVVRGRVVWEIPYNNVARLTLVKGFFGSRVLGVCFVLPASFHHARIGLRPVGWKRGGRWWQKWWGVDFIIWLKYAEVPPESLLEAAVGCLHRYRAETGLCIPT